MPYHFPRCQLVPLPEEQVSFVLEGVERLRWHFSKDYPRPFFYPLVGPSGSSLTRMGHPGAPNHDHHRSIWFAHAKVVGIDFWSEQTQARIRQQAWLQYQDGDEEAIMAVSLGWFDGHDPAPLVEQELIAATRPGSDGELQIELQSTFRPQAESLEFGQTNFGFLAVRVAKNISAFFGGGRLRSSEGGVGEAELFGKPARWIDYSGPVPSGGDEGITYFDHPTNVGFPTPWHVREDGWMGAAVSLQQSRTTMRSSPLVLRYLLHVHRGSIDAQRADQISQQFSSLKPYEVVKSAVKHTHRVIQRAAG